MPSIHIFFSRREKKLSIIIYNKEIQSKINRNIYYYKSISSKNLKIDNNGIGKIYDLDGNLIFGGEYSNKKKNGKGKVYRFGILKFDGEYKNGKKNGKGKLFNLNGRTLLFEGEFKDGKRNGKGKEYNIFSYLIFEGEFLNGERWNSLLKIHYKQVKLLFEGEYKNGKIWNGKGYKFNNNEIDFEIIDGNGKIKMYDSSYGNLYFEGNLINGEISGKGKEYKHQGKVSFEGEFLNGKKNGFGKEYYSIGNLQFEGIYKENMKWEGKGFNIDGEFEYEIKNGNGRIIQYKEVAVAILKFEG